MKGTLSKISATLLIAFLAACSPATASTPEGIRSVNTISIAGIDRSYILHLPPKYDGHTKLPLVMLLHGGSDSAAYAEEAYHFVEKATVENFILVLPDALAVRRAWGGLDPDTAGMPNNDLAFLTTLLQTLPAKYAMDPTKCYVCGHSSGAIMTYRLAAEHPDLIAAAGIMAGYVDPDIIKPKAPVPFIIFHGKLDPTIPYENLAPAVELWKKINKCDLASRSPLHQDLTPNVTEDFYPSPSTADITVYTLQNGNHMWPGGKAMPGKTQIPVQDISATDLMWQFFQFHQRSPASAAFIGPVQIETGLVAGAGTKTADVAVYKGIPYAAPPVGGLRWHSPKPAAAWQGIFKADHFGAACPQPPYAPGSFYQLEYFQGDPPPMSEDCLYLNVWTGAKSASERRPVMVWIHGGGGVQGYSSEPCFDGEAFASKGVILVSFNYRLGILGLFAHPELSGESPHHVSGNYAELDQIAALAWVQRNIAVFGGDPQNVTVFGQSSGGASINRLLVSPLAKGLFQHVIIESAAVLNSRDSKAKLADMEKRGIAFGEAIGARDLAALRAVSPADLLVASQKMHFDPNIDGYVLPELAANIFERGGQYPVPMLIGSNSDEGQFVPVKAETFHQDIEKRFGDTADALFRLYPAATDDEAAIAKHDERRDESFAGERAEATAQAKLGVPVYLYYFDRKPPGHDRERYGAFHAAELEYVFNTQNATDRPWESIDRQLAATLISYWTNFAKTGSPNAAELPEWKRFDSATEASMELGERTGTRVTPDKARLDFLETFLNKEAR